MTNQQDIQYKKSKMAEQKGLILSIIATGSIMIVEIIGGILSNSLSLLSDAWHMFTDILALVSCLVAGTIAMKPPTISKTFGYHRMEILTALANGVTLVIVAIFIFYEAANRLLQPMIVSSLEMLIVAMIGLSSNIISLGFLSKITMGLNIKAAFFHVLGDALSSIGVIIAGIIIFFTGLYFVDSIMSIIIAVIIIIGTSKILREVLHILLEGTPSKINLRDVLKSIRSVEGVADVHDLHIWSITTYQNYLIAHLVVKKDDISNLNEILNTIKKELSNRYRINHTTLQIETEGYVEIGEIHGVFE